MKKTTHKQKYNLSNIKKRGSISRKPIFSYNKNGNLIIMFSAEKLNVILKEMVTFLGQSIKILLEGHIWRELWLGLQY